MQSNEFEISCVMSLSSPPEAYLEPSGTFTVELFCENSWWLLTANCFRKKSSS